MTSNSKRLFHYVSKQKKKIILGVLATLLTSLVELATGGLLKFLIKLLEKMEGSITENGAELLKLPLKYNFKIPILDKKVNVIQTTLQGSDDIFKGLLWLCIVFVFLYLLQAFFNYLRRVFMNAATQRILQNFKADIYHKILKLPYSFFSKNKTGDVVSRVTYDVTTLSEIIDLLIEVARASVYILVFVPVMFYMDWQLALFTMVFFPLSIILIDLVTNKVKTVSKNITDNVGDYTAFLEERINRFNMVKAYGKEKDEEKIFNHLVEENYEHNLSLIKLRFSMNPTNDFLGMLVVAGVYLIASYKITHGLASVASMFMFLYLVKVAFKPIKKVAEAWGRLHVALVSTNKIFRLLDECDENQNASNDVSVDEIKSVSFNEVSFGYPDASVDLFQNVSFTLNQGDVILLSGKTGVGKSTLLNLLPALLYPKNGTIAINENPYPNMSLNSIRKVVKLVGSADTYFDGSVFDNLTYGCHNKRSKQITKYLTFLGLKSENELHQQIGKNGIALSTGQQQKLAVVRALLTKPQLLILDEVFTSLDSEDIDFIFKEGKSIPMVTVVSRKQQVQSNCTKEYVLKDRILETKTQTK